MIITKISKFKVEITIFFYNCDLHFVRNWKQYLVLNVVSSFFSKFNTTMIQKLGITTSYYLWMQVELFLIPKICQSMARDELGAKADVIRSHFILMFILWNYEEQNIMYILYLCLVFTHQLSESFNLYISNCF